MEEWHHRNWNDNDKGTRGNHEVALTKPWVTLYTENEPEKRRPNKYKAWFTSGKNGTTIYNISKRIRCQPVLQVQHSSRMAPKTGIGLPTSVGKEANPEDFQRAILA